MTSLAATTTCFPNICTPKFQLCSHPGLGRRVICQTFSSPTTKVLRDVPLESISGSAELTRSLGRAQPERSVHHEIDGAANLARNQFIHGGIDGRVFTAMPNPVKKRNSENSTSSRKTRSRQW
jgi:hypothetical protein